MFKIDKEKFFKHISYCENQALDIYDHVSKGYIEIDNHANIDFSNCLITFDYLVHDNIVLYFYLPDDIETISVEDKLTYDLPYDIFIDNDINWDWGISIPFWYNDIKNLSIEMQIKILSYIFECEVYMKSH